MMKKRISGTNAYREAFKRDSRRDSTCPATPEEDAEIEHIEKEMQAFIAATPELGKGAGVKSCFSHICAAAGEKAAAFRQAVSGLLDFKENTAVLREKCYNASVKIDESLEGFRNVAEELATAVILLGGLTHYRINHAIRRSTGKTKKTYGIIAVDRKFEKKAEKVFDRLSDFRFGRIFDDIRGRKRFVYRKLDEFAQKKIAFSKNLEAHIDKVIDGFTSNRRGFAVKATAFACCFMLCCVTVNAGTVYNYSYHGTELGKVRDKEKVEQAVSRVKEDVPEASNVSVAVSAEPDVDITYEKEFSFSAAVDSADAVADKIANCDDLMADGFAINVDGVTVAMVDTEETANKVLDTVKAKFYTVDSEKEAALKESLRKIANTDNISKDNTEDKAAAEPAKGEAIVNAAVTRNIVLSDSAVKDTGVITEVPENGEAAEAAIKNGIISRLSFDLIDELNLDISLFTGASTDNISFAENVAVEPVKAKVSSFVDYDSAVDLFIDENGESRYLTVNSREIEAAEEEIPFETEYEDTADLYEGETEVTVEGVPGFQKVLYSVTREYGNEVDRRVIDKKIITEPKNAKALRGTKERPKTAATGEFAMPAQARLTSGFGRRWGRMHKGIDLAGPVGTPVYAADGGTVTYAEYNSGGYGYLVKIDHGNGMETFYAHNSKLLVSKGDKVFKGQNIAKMGSTGRSTGPHLHFEIRVGGTAVNPMNYLK